MKRNKIMKFLMGAVAISVLSTTSITTTAFASDLSGTKDKEITSSSGIKLNLTEENKESLDNWLSQYNVDSNTKALLLEKLEKGQLWDSVTSSSPIKTEKLDENTSKNTYADGSISITGVTDGSVKSTSSKKGDISLDDVDGGKTESGSGYVNHTYSKVSEDLGLINAYFYADYTFVQGGDDYIDDAYDEYVHSNVISISNVSLSVNRPKETYNHAAEATLKFLGDTNYSSGTLYLKLVVSHDSAYSQAKFS
ncbi:hypothetical protein [Clostridium sp.]|uniref:hypothetical protein n=1 Tax=Clostridium sp. TaxID=1506 RepID=UPI00283DCD6E|nr:hypothetical protein [Clostridium sp.]MDR3597842.1 hypothetical protein [Clostridium sp.]